MARGEDGGTWGGRSDAESGWPPAQRPRTREEARADLDRRTDEADVDRRHDWRARGGGEPRGGEYRTGVGSRGGAEAWPPGQRPRTREEARADLDRRTDEADIDRRHDWRRGGERGGEARGARPPGEAWPPSSRPRSRDELRADLDRRTDERDIDRRHDWRPGGRPEGPPSRQGRMAPSRMARPRSPEELREDLDRRTDAHEINRRHAWQGGERGYREEETRERPPLRRGFAGPDWAEGEPDLARGRAPRAGEGRGEERFDERPYLREEGPEEDRGHGAAGEAWDDRDLPTYGGYGGYGGGEYGGSYGGIGPGKTGTYPAA
jgi:hypothetical protein